MKRFSKKEIFSIPNLMGYFRILLIPVFCYLYITAETEREYLYAALVVLLSSLTDLFDGKIARRFHMVTELGKPERTRPFPQFDQRLLQRPHCDPVYAYCFRCGVYCGGNHHDEIRANHSLWKSAGDHF